VSEINNAKRSQNAMSDNIYINAKPKANKGSVTAEPKEGKCGNEFIYMPLGKEAEKMQVKCKVNGKSSPALESEQLYVLERENIEESQQGSLEVNIDGENIALIKELSKYKDKINRHKDIKVNIITIDKSLLEPEVINMDNKTTIITNSFDVENVSTEDSNLGRDDSTHSYYYEDPRMKVALGDRKGVNLEFSDEFIMKVNNKLGDHVTLIKADKKNITMLDVGGKYLDVQVGRATLPNIRMSKDFKSLKELKIAFKGGVGFNTIEGNVGYDIEIFGIKSKGGFRGAIGGLSARGSFSFKVKSGFKASFIVVPGIGGGGYFSVEW